MKSKVAENITQTIGETPLLRLKNICLQGNLLAKLEFFNPGGSIKDRIALNMIEKAIERKEITFGATLIEATSGNTGIGLAMIAASKGFKLIIVMPESMSIERRKLIAHFGAHLVLTPAAEGMTGAVRKAKEIHNQTPGSMIVNQFANPDNPGAHLNKTALEILDQTNGNIDFFVAAVGTGGTISGTGGTLKKSLPHVKVIALEPEKSPILSGGTPGPHKIQGIGAGFIPNTLNTDVYDQVITIKDEDAIETAKLLAQKEGVLCGISSGANVWAAHKIAMENPDKIVVTIICDTGERYLSTALFE